ncbi:MAG: PASTA domain-containing protein [Ruminococcus sp.]|nr:PASTA domain-containing protein [Ruminococcus sp.]
MNDKNYDFLRELTEVDDMKISEIAKKYPVPDKATLKRINAKCEEKLKMRQNDINENITENSEQEKVEVVRNMPWYGNPWITSAACFAVILGSTIGIMTLFNGKQMETKLPDNPPITAVETTTEAVTAETTTDSDSAVITDIQTTAAVPENNSEKVEMPELIGKSISDVESEYKEYFTVVADSYEYNEDYEAGIIIAQDVQPDTHISIGSTVKVVVSQGSKVEPTQSAVTELPDEELSEEIPADETERMSDSLHALDFIQQIMSNGPEFECDMDDNFTDESGQLYVKVTESGFNSIADVENYIRSYMTDNCINNGYSGLIDRNSGKFIETENGLYIRYAPKAAAFNLMDKKIFAKVNDDTYVVIGCYDDYGVLSTIDVNFVSDGDNLKIDAIKFNEE